MEDWTSAVDFGGQKWKAEQQASQHNKKRSTRSQSVHIIRNVRPFLADCCWAVPSPKGAKGASIIGDGLTLLGNGNEIHVETNSGPERHCPGI